MRYSTLRYAVLLVIVTAVASAQTIRMISVEPGVQLETLDWGGTGRAVVLLAGLGNTAHIFDNFAPSLTSQYHVYGVTRRGFGASSKPAAGYDPARLGEDILVVVEALQLRQPILVGHSIAGEELSWIGAHRPDRIAGLVYLDAEFKYAFFGADVPDFDLDLVAVQESLTALKQHTSDVKLLASANVALTRFHNDVQAQQDFASLPPPPPRTPTDADKADAKAYAHWFSKYLGGEPPPSEVTQTFTIRPDGSVDHPVQSAAGPLILASVERFTHVDVPALIIAACPHNGESTEAADRARYAALDRRLCEPQIEAAQTADPQAKVLLLPLATHYVFLSRREEVLTAIRSFINSLP